MSQVRIARRRRLGLTLIEVMIAMTLLMIATLGTISYRYHVSLHTQKAQKQATAARIALLMSESWKGQKGSTAFDATVFSATLDIVTSANGPSTPSGLTPLETYKIVCGNYNYYATLSWREISDDFLELNIQVAWGFQTHGATDFSTDDRIYALTTCVGT